MAEVSFVVNIITMKHNYHVTGMTCASCEKKVKAALAIVPGVKNIEIDRNSQTVTVSMNAHIATTTLQQALYEYPKYQLTDTIVPPVTGIAEEEPGSWLAIYRPLLLVFGYIILVTLMTAISYGSWDLMHLMRVFMAGFFLVFSFFKMLNLQGFADSYSMYDIVAKRFRAWGYVYPFVELALGIAFSVNFYPVVTNSITLLVMLVSIVGVLQSVFNKRKIRCACLGAVFNLPMSTVTIIEDLLMIGMSAAMLYQI